MPSRRWNSAGKETNYLKFQTNSCTPGGGCC
jgi:hypothetical protein